MSEKWRPLEGVTEAVNGIIDRLSLPAREKRQLQEELTRLFTARERELAEGAAEVKDMRASSSERVKFGELADYMKRRI